MFSVLYVASTPESDLILETTFELRSCKGKPISNKTQPINQWLQLAYPYFRALRIRCMLCFRFKIYLARGIIHISCDRPFLKRPVAINKVHLFS